MIRIGYVVEGWRDRAFVHGLKERWCRGAELIEGHFRGSTGLSISRELARSCKELLAKQASFIVALRDANKEDWRDVRDRETGRVPEQARHCTVYAVAARNMEDWLSADLGYLAHQLGIPVEDLRAGDVRAALDRVVGARVSADGEDRIVGMVRAAPLKHWILSSPSFEAFYEDVRSMAQRSGTCEIPNERET